MSAFVGEALARYVDRLKLRSSLTKEEERVILDLPGQPLTYHGERDFVDVGDRVDRSCLVVDGLVARFAQLRNGQRGIVALHIPGDMTDLHSLVSPHVSWALRTMCPTTIIEIPHSALHDAASRHPGIAFAFWRDCVVDANTLAQWAVNLGRRDAMGRLSHLLCELAARYDAIGLARDGRYPFPITQANLADAVGLTPIHLNRVLKRLRDDGIAAKTLAEVHVKDFGRLTAYGEFDPAYLQISQDPRMTARHETGVPLRAL